MRNLQTPEELLDAMADIDYGYIDKQGQKHFEVDNEFDKKYFLQTPEEVAKNRIGVCWDQVEYERKFFRVFGLSFETFFIVYYTDAECPSHTFLMFERDEKFCWFEHSWGPYRGIHAYDSKQALFDDVCQKFLDSHKLKDFNPQNLCLNKYNRPKPHLSCLEFYHFQEKCRANQDIFR